MTRRKPGFQSGAPPPPPVPMSPSCDSRAGPRSPYAVCTLSQNPVPRLPMSPKGIVSTVHKHTHAHARTQQPLGPTTGQGVLQRFHAQQRRVSRRSVTFRGTASAGLARKRGGRASSAKSGKRQPGSYAPFSTCVRTQAPFPSQFAYPGRRPASACSPRCRRQKRRGPGPPRTCAGRCSSPETSSTPWSTQTRQGAG
jgi:hypothetical protein